MVLQTVSATRNWTKIGLESDNLGHQNTKLPQPLVHNTHTVHTHLVFATQLHAQIRPELRRVFT